MIPINCRYKSSDHCGNSKSDIMKRMKDFQQSNFDSAATVCNCY